MTPSRLFSFLRNLLLVTAVLHLLAGCLVALWFLPYQLGVMIGLSGGYLVINCVALVYRGEIGNAYLSALICVWVYWSVWGIALSMGETLDAVIFSFLGVVAFCGTCLSACYAARWYRRQAKLQISLAQIFLLLAIVGVLCGVMSDRLDVLVLTAQLISLFLPTLVGCFVLTTRQTRAFFSIAMLCVIVFMFLLTEGFYLLGFHLSPYVEYQTMLLIESLFIWIAGVRYLQATKDEDSLVAPSSATTASPPRSEFAPDPRDEL